MKEQLKGQKEEFQASNFPECQESSDAEPTRPPGSESRPTSSSWSTITLRSLDIGSHPPQTPITMDTEDSPWNGNESLILQPLREMLSGKNRRTFALSFEHHSSQSGGISRAR